MAFVSQPTITADGTTCELSAGVLSVKGPVLVGARSSTTGTPAVGTVIATLSAAAGSQLVDVAYSGRITSAGSNNPDLGVTLTFSDATTMDMNPNFGGAGQLDIWGDVQQCSGSRTGSTVVCVQAPSSVAGKKVTKVEVKVTDADLANSRTYTGVIAARETKL